MKANIQQLEPLLLNKKKINIILITVLVVVWSAVGYKFFGDKSPQKQIEYVSNYTNLKVNTSEFKKEDLQLVFFNSNPFKSSKSRIAKVRAINPIKNRVKKSSVTKNRIWPNIAYYGFVKSNSSKTKLALVKVNTKLYKRRESEKIGELTIKKAYGDSIIMKFNNELKTIISN